MFVLRFGLFLGFIIQGIILSKMDQTLGQLYMLLISCCLMSHYAFDKDSAIGSPENEIYIIDYINSSAESTGAAMLDN